MRRAAAVLLPVLVVLLVSCGGGGGAAARPEKGRAKGVRLLPVGRFDAPLDVTAPPGDTRRIFVVEQAGRIMVVRGGRKLARPFLDLRRQVLSGGEQGLLGLAFAPDYERSRRFYVYFTGRDSDEHVVEYRAASEDVADAGSARPVLVMADPAPNHNGGSLVFGPDRHLYIGTGDGGDENDARGNGQSLRTLLGKILRIDPVAAGGRPYTVPSDNPFVHRAGARPEIYSYGLRNPWRFSFDPRTGDLYIGDVGQDAVEEVDAVAAGRGAGANFGWRAWEGRRRNYDERAPGAIFPVLDLRHRDGFCSVTGGYVVRDPALPALAGRYVFGDYCDGHLLTARITPGRPARARRLGSLRVDALSSFGQDARGRVYAVSLNGGVYRLVPRG